MTTYAYSPKFLQWMTPKAAAAPQIDLTPNHQEQLLRGISDVLIKEGGLSPSELLGVFGAAVEASAGQQKAADFRKQSESFAGEMVKTGIWPALGAAAARAVPFLTSGARATASAAPQAINLVKQMPMWKKVLGVGAAGAGGYGIGKGLEAAWQGVPTTQHVADRVQDGFLDKAKGFLKEYSPHIIAGLGTLALAKGFGADTPTALAMGALGGVGGGMAYNKYMRPDVDAAGGIMPYMDQKWKNMFPGETPEQKAESARQQAVEQSHQQAKEQLPGKK